MKYAVIATLALFSLTSFAGETLLKCNLPMSGMDYVEFIANDESETVTANVRWTDGDISTYQESRSLIQSDEILIRESWHGYDLTLIREGNGQWALRHEDECSGGTSFNLRCTGTLK